MIMIDTLYLDDWTVRTLLNLRLAVFNDDRQFSIYYTDDLGQIQYVLCNIPNNECLKYYLIGRIAEKVESIPLAT